MFVHVDSSCHNNCYKPGPDNGNTQRKGMLEANSGCTYGRQNCQRQSKLRHQATRYAILLRQFS